MPVAATRFLTFVVTVALTLGCKKNPDPNYIDVARFRSGKQLADTLKYTIGMPEAGVWEMMNRNGFKCGERHDDIVKDRQLAPGRLNLECWYEHRIELGLRRRVWTVTFPLDSSRVREVYAGFIKQDL